MPEAQLKKDQFRLNRGLNTESNEISFPDGFTIDERNYELLVDGSRRRRKALDQESGGSAKTVATIATDQAHTSFKWRGVGGDPDKNFIVHQVGNVLYFSDDAETISTTYHTDTVTLDSFRISNTITDAQQAAESVQFSRGRGHLFITSKYQYPIFIEYNATGDSFIAARIQLRVRDFDGISDGVSDQLQPGSIDDDHRYNLRNRGWIEADIATYFTGQSVYPSKAQVWHKGYRRQTNVNFSDLDGIQTFDDTKLAAEQFGQSSAPQGGLFLDPLDTRFSASNTNEGTEVQISTWSMTGSPSAGGVVSITTVAAHGRSNGDSVTISGNIHDDSSFGIGSQLNSLDGFWIISNVGATTFDFTLSSGSGGNGFNDQFKQLGQINGNVSLPKSDGSQLTVGPTAVVYHGARIWYAGIPDSEWADTIFFTKIAQKSIAYGVCHQEADPTNPSFNQLSSSDGGTIVIPNLGKVQRLISLRAVLLVFSDNGVWEVGGGQRGLFTATGYSIRKITDAECSSSQSPISLGTNVVYTGPRGVHSIAPNEFTSLLEEVNISESLIQTLWNSIPAVNQKVIQTVHDDALNRVYFLYGDSGISGSTDNINQYANALVLDIRVGAWYKYVFDVSTTSGILTAYSITESDSSDSSKKIKWATQATDTIVTADLDQTDFVDFGGSESPLPFMISGHDNIGDFQSRRQAPIITVYSKRTETGYTATGNGFDADNESSTLMAAFWDWTEAKQWDVPALPTIQEDWDGTTNNFGVSGKIGSQNEVYRHVRGFVPLAGTDSDGYPVVVTRNKVRGRGRVLQLRFNGAATKDSHILGFTTNYKVSRNK